MNEKEEFEENKIKLKDIKISNLFDSQVSQQKTRIRRKTKSTGRKPRNRHLTGE